MGLRQAPDAPQRFLPAWNESFEMDDSSILETRRKAVVLLSGGLDSSTLLHQMMYEEYEVLALGVFYGQRHHTELAAAKAVAKQAGVSFVELSLAQELFPIFAGAQSSQVGDLLDVPRGHYADESMKLTIVPGRNLLLLALATAYAHAQGATTVAYAAHAGDHPIYPDCRPDFASAVSRATLEGYGVEIYRPFIGISKTDIVRRGSALKVPFVLTYSCYEGKADIHCGLCGTCVERKEAFRDAGVEDPTPYWVGEGGVLCS